MIDDIKQILANKKACALSELITDYDSAIKLIYTSQGREFCKKHSFPGILLWRKHLSELEHIDDLFIDKGEVYSSSHSVIAVGETSINLTAGFPDKLYIIVAMHGAKVHINASKYAVVTVLNIGAEIETENDGTALIVYE